MVSVFHVAVSQSVCRYLWVFVSVVSCLPCLFLFNKVQFAFVVRTYCFFNVSTIGSEIFYPQSLFLTSDHDLLCDGILFFTYPLLSMLFYATTGICFSTYLPTSISPSHSYSSSPC